LISSLRETVNNPEKEKVKAPVGIEEILTLRGLSRDDWFKKNPPQEDNLRGIKED
jgi:hypothetical protein